MIPVLLVLNAGSSNLQFQVFEYRVRPMRSAGSGPAPTDLMNNRSSPWKR